MTRNNRDLLYDLLQDLALEYIEENDIAFEDNERWENDEIIVSIDTLKWHLEEKM